ncbi:hypothetical protein, variant [Phytophthora nicotianae INRA-310]|uniref:Uncharacterized protein n=1 Tax=Phytophthora nicotianae (strain INRA-310) TaxID=761204 RepID=W2QTT4_PHYN3|nr:hypothetical protein PPTG_21834 [Phytophthora nicotianae INRA-310]XP_008898784.1 hypothetical protein, variant [Phytophthora nicotianae INRA-310]ETN15903.1 hypothetical protein PPTG_21834 [Phytophthora nicotianae INRA-310]ETN15904.1 hypothetical protein, variant [Phytophthora nicotianae INRA-310]
MRNLSLQLSSTRSDDNFIAPDCTMAFQAELDRPSDSVFVVGLNSHVAPCVVPSERFFFLLNATRLKKFIPIASSSCYDTANALESSSQQQENDSLDCNAFMTPVLTPQSDEPPGTGRFVADLTSVFTPDVVFICVTCEEIF